MAWSYAGSSYGGADCDVALSGDLVVTLPSVSDTDPTPTWAAGDVLVLQVASRDNVVCTVPLGWLAVDSGTNNGTGFRTHSFWKVAVSGETDPTITHAAGGKISAVIHAIRGLSQVSALSVIGLVKANASSTSVVANGITTGQANECLVFMGAALAACSFDSYTGTPTPDERFDQPNATTYPSLCMATSNISTGGTATGDLQCTASTARLNNGHLVTFRETFSPPMPNAYIVPAESGSIDRDSDSTDCTGHWGSAIATTGWTAYGAPGEQEWRGFFLFDVSSLSINQILSARLYVYDIAFSGVTAGYRLKVHPVDFRGRTDTVSFSIAAKGTGAIVMPASRTTPPGTSYYHDFTAAEMACVGTPSGWDNLTNLLNWPAEPQVYPVKTYIGIRIVDDSLHDADFLSAPLVGGAFITLTYTTTATAVAFQAHAGI
jgi:hypothetical protein